MSQAMLYEEQQELDLPGCRSSLQLYLAEINAIPRLSHAEEKDLAAKIQAGDAEAKQRFILANLRLVVKAAKRRSTTDLELLDHIQNGYFGLVRAVERFDPAAYDVHFATYAMLWIKQAIMRSQDDTARLIRLPSYLQEELRSMDRAADEWLVAHGTEAPDEYLADHLGVDVEHIRMLRFKCGRTLSLDFSDEDQDGDDEPTLADYLSDPQAEESYDQIDVQDLHEGLSGQVRYAMNTVLTERERLVVGLYFGLNGEAMPRYADIGRVIGVSRTRARVILVNALPKLRPALSTYQEVGA
jgi:RNA polymerase sigma factor (sigma-70 family)